MYLYMNVLVLVYTYYTQMYILYIHELWLQYTSGRVQLLEYACQGGKRSSIHSLVNSSSFSLGAKYKYMYMYMYYCSTYTLYGKTQKCSCTCIYMYVISVNKTNILHVQGNVNCIFIL